MFPFTRLPISGTYFRPTPIEFCRHHLTSVSCLPRLPGFALEVHGAYGGPDAFMQRMCPEKSEPRLGPPHYLSYAPRTKHRESQWFHGRFFSFSASCFFCSWFICAHVRLWTTACCESPDIEDRMVWPGQWGPFLRSERGWERPRKP